MFSAHILDELQRNMSRARADGPVGRVRSLKSCRDWRTVRSTSTLGILDVEGNVLLPRSLPERGGFQGIRLD